MMTMEKQTFEWGGAVFTVSPATIGSYMKTSRITAVLLDTCPDADDLARYYFSRCAAQTWIDGSLAVWQPPTNDTITESFEAWLELPSELANLWIKALTNADAPTADEELQPVHEDKSDPKD